MERRIADGTISQTQIFLKDGKRFVAVQELLRVFGEPRNRPEAETAGARHAATTAGDGTGGAERGDLIAELRDRLQRAEALADAERERANRYERERDELREKYDALVTRLLPPPAPKKSAGWFRRMFGE